MDDAFSIGCLSRASGGGAALGGVRPCYLSNPTLGFDNDDDEGENRRGL